jgi:CopG antitoxin of type II toxin-antitoxin system
MAKRKTDPIPEEFESYEEAAEFWDNHDTTDYPNDFRTIPAVTTFRGRHFEIEIDADVAKALRVRARKKRTTVDRLASDLLRKQLEA